MSKLSKWVMLVLISATFAFSLAACKEEGAAETLGKEVVPKAVFVRGVLLDPALHQLLGDIHQVLLASQ